VRKTGGLRGNPFAMRVEEDEETGDVELVFSLPRNMPAGIPASQVVEVPAGVGEKSEAARKLEAFINRTDPQEETAEEEPSSPISNEAENKGITSEQVLPEKEGLMPENEGETPQTSAADVNAETEDQSTPPAGDSAETQQTQSNTTEKQQPDQVVMTKAEYDALVAGKNGLLKDLTKTRDELKTLKQKELTEEQKRIA
jgi:hypothetical protein